MPSRIKKSFKNGIWIKNWKFKSDQNPFNSKMTQAAVLKTKHKIEKFAHRTLNDRNKWKLIGEPFAHLIFQSTWKTVISSTKPPVFILNVEVLDPLAPPREIIIAPPPPKQPPPPNSL